VSKIENLDFHYFTFKTFTMTSKKTKAAKKKKTAKKKTSRADSQFGLWIDFNILKGVFFTPHLPSMTRAQIEAYYTQALDQFDQHTGQHHLIKFTWTVVGGNPPVTNLKAYVSPKPVINDGPPNGGNPVVQPTPPPQPPPPTL